MTEKLLCNSDFLRFDFTLDPYLNWSRIGTTS